MWLALLAVVYFSAFAFYPRLFFILGVNHFNVWFLDSFAVLASNDALSAGRDPYANNPLDYLGRPHVYSHWWLHLRDLGLTRGDTVWLGISLAVAFLLAALGRLRPRTARELLWYAAVLGSAPVLLALDRGNNDLVIFILLAFLVPGLLSSRRLVRFLAPALVVLAAMLKYYPAVSALLLLGGADPRERRVRLLFTAMLGALAAVSMSGDLATAGSRSPVAEGMMSFGATGVFNALGWTGWAPKLVCGAVGLAFMAWCWFGRVLGAWEPDSARSSDYLHFILGAVLLTGCFFANMNYGYRWVFSIWLAPLLWRLPREAAAPGSVCRLADWTGGLLLFALWWTPVYSFVLNRLVDRVPEAKLRQLQQWGFLIEQPVDWAFFLCLLVFLVHFTRRQLGEVIPRRT